MKALRPLTISIGFVLLFVGRGVSYGEKAEVSLVLQRQVESFTKAYDNYYQEKDFEGLMTLFDNDFSYVFSGIGKEELKHMVEKASEGRNYTKVETTTRGIQPKDNFIVARTSVFKKWQTVDGKEEEHTTNYVLFLQERNGQLLIKTSSKDIDEGSFDPVSRIYQSKKGKYSIEIPEKWMPVKEVLALEVICPDNVVALAPDFKSCVVLGFVQLPFPIPAKQAVETDEATAKRMVSEYKVFEEGEIKIGDLAGYRSVSEFKERKDYRKRERVYFSHEPFLYFFICDAIPREKYDSLKEEFESIVHSFKITSPGEGLSLKEEVAAELGQGSISGQIYTNRDYDCFIAAPDSTLNNHSLLYKQKSVV